MEEAVARSVKAEEDRCFEGEAVEEAGVDIEARWRCAMAEIENRLERLAVAEEVTVSVGDSLDNRVVEVARMLLYSSQMFGHV